MLRAITAARPTRSAAPRVMRVRRGAGPRCSAIVDLLSAGAVLGPCNAQCFHCRLTVEVHLVDLVVEGVRAAEADTSVYRLDVADLLVLRLGETRDRTEDCHG